MLILLEGHNLKLGVDMSGNLCYNLIRLGTGGVFYFPAKCISFMSKQLVVSLSGNPLVFLVSHEQLTTSFLHSWRLEIMGKAADMLDGLIGDEFIRTHEMIKRQGATHLYALMKKLYKQRGECCEMCHEKLPIKELTPHHRHYRNQWFEEPEDIILMCKSCHRGLHERHKEDRLTREDAPFIDPLWVDKNGDIIPGRKSPLGEIRTIYNLNCRHCGSKLRPDVEYNQDRFGENWFDADMENLSFYCPSCEDGGLYGEMVETC